MTDEGAEKADRDGAPASNHGPAYAAGATFVSEAMLAFRALRGVVAGLGERNVGLISAGVAFFAILAIFPGIAAVIAVFGFVADPAVIAGQLDLLAEFTPPEAFALVETQVNGLIATNESALRWTTIISTGAALWSSRAGVAALQRGLNAIHGADNRSSLWHVLSALALTGALVGVVIVALAAVIVVPVVLRFLPLGQLLGIVLKVLPWAIAVGMIVFGLAVMYRFGPNRRGARGRIWPGVWLAVSVWAAASVGFSFYLANFGNYNEIYGSIGAVIALLMWFYIGAFVVLLGAALNAEMDRLRPPAPRRRAAPG